MDDLLEQLNDLKEVLILCIDVIIHFYYLAKSRMRLLIVTTYMILLPSITRRDQESSTSQVLLKDILVEEVGKEPCKEAKLVVHAVKLDIPSHPVLIYGNKGSIDFVK